jgi:hypothetical protein
MRTKDNARNILTSTLTNGSITLFLTMLKGTSKTSSTVFSEKSTNDFDIFYLYEKRQGIHDQFFRLLRQDRRLLPSPRLMLKI